MIKMKAKGKSNVITNQKLVKRLVIVVALYESSMEGGQCVVAACNQFPIGHTFLAGMRKVCCEVVDTAHYYQFKIGK